jgi:hypothetical protein
MTSLKYLAQLNNLYTNSVSLPTVANIGLSTPISVNPIAVVPSVIQYQNVNADATLRTDVTKFFNRKVIKHITENSDLSHLEKELPFLKSSDGWKFIYKLLRKFVKNTQINWYDLRDNYRTVRDYIISKL